jgi:hypothetical protein
MTLIEAAVLHEQIFFLRASLPDDLGQLELRNRLLAQGALAPLPKRDDHDLIGKALVAALSTTQGLAVVAGSREVIGKPLLFEYFSGRLEEELQLRSLEDVGAGSTRLNEGYDIALYASGPAVAYNAESFDDAARELIGWMEYRYSGAYEASMASFRAMYYVFASEHHGLPYLPSFSVEKLARDFPNYFGGSVRRKLYARLASALRAAVDAVARDFESELVFVPPFSALVLDRAATPAQIPRETLALREEYSNFRAKMRELEHDRAEAETLNARLKATHQIEELCKEVARPFDQPSRMRVEASLRYIPQAAELAANPTNPVGWARLLLEKPADALISWYRRRPVTKLVQTAKAIGSLRQYDRLLAKHFGDEISKHVLEWRGDR